MELVGTRELTLKMVATQQVAYERSKIKIDPQFYSLFYCHGKSSLVIYRETKLEISSKHSLRKILFFFWEFSPSIFPGILTWSISIHRFYFLIHPFPWTYDEVGLKVLVLGLSTEWASM